MTEDKRGQIGKGYQKILVDPSDLVTRHWKVVKMNRSSNRTRFS